MTLSKKALLSAILLATAYPIYAADDELDRKGTPPHVVPLSRDQRSDDPSAVTASGSAVTASGSAIGHKIPADPTPMASAPRVNSIADELARIRSQQLSDQNHLLQQACDSYARTSEQWKDRSAALSTEIAQLKRQLAQSHEDYLSVVTGLELLRTESEDLTRQITSLTEDKRVLSAKISGLPQDAEAKVSEIRNLDVIKKRLDAALLDSSEQQRSLKQELAALQAKLLTLTAESETCLLYTSPSPRDH
jgi:chromosome segregation ATPase